MGQDGDFRPSDAKEYLGMTRKSKDAEETTGEEIAPETSEPEVEVAPEDIE